MLSDFARAAAETFALAQVENDGACPCADIALCKPISGPPLRAREIYGFGGGDGSTLDFARVTTVAWASDTRLMCAAHKHGARVILSAPKPERVFLANATVRREWVAKAVRAVVNSFSDGLVFDWESPCAAGCAEQKAYIALIGATRAALRRLSPSYQISTCVAWAPDDIDGRDYDVVGLAAVSDMLYVMDYDTRSQVFDACIAAANAPYYGMVKGISRYRDLGISASQLVLGVPWYGYRYPCLPGTGADARFCPIRRVPFRGVACSDAAGSQVPVGAILQRLRLNSTGGRQWDSTQGAPYFNTVEGNVTVQYWYDDVASLVPKYQYARRAGLRGVGPYVFMDVLGATPFFDAFDAFLLPAPSPPPPGR